MFFAQGILNILFRPPFQKHLELEYNFKLNVMQRNRFNNIQ